MPRPKTRACPPSGVDTIAVNIEQTYTVEGVGSDTVSLEGSLTLERGVPLVDPQHGKVDWKTSIQVANVKALDVSGTSDVFGPVHIAAAKPATWPRRSTRGSARSHPNHTHTTTTPTRHDHPYPLDKPTHYIACRPHDGRRAADVEEGDRVA